MAMPSGSSLVIYASKYGSTAEYAAAIGRVLDARVLRVNAVGDEELKGVGLLVLGSPIYGPAVLPEMAVFLERYGHLLRGRTIAAFVVCGDTLWIPKAGEGGHRNLDKLTSLLPLSPIAQAVFGGRMRMADLDEEDHPKIIAFYKRLGREPFGFDRMDLDEARLWAVQVRLLLENRSIQDSKNQTNPE